MPTTDMPRQRPSGFLTFVWALFFFLVFAFLVVIWVRASGPSDSVDQKRGQERVAKRSELDKAAQELLGTVGWTDQAKGVVHIPITNAKRLVIAELQGKKPAASQVKVEPPLPMPALYDPNAVDPAPAALPSSPQGADTLRFDLPPAMATPASAPATNGQVVPAPQSSILGAASAPTAPLAVSALSPAPQSTAPTAAPPVVLPAPLPGTTVSGAAPAQPAAANAPVAVDPAVLAQGKANYMTVCVACHQPNGAGLPMVFPPLTKSEYVSGSAERFAAMILKGNAGPMTIDGKPYNNIMPGQETMLDDAKIAAIMTFVRVNFQNSAPPVTPESVAATRKRFSDRKTPWTEAELKAWTDSAVAPSVESVPTLPSAAHPTGAPLPGAPLPGATISGPAGLLQPQVPQPAAAEPTQPSAAAPAPARPPLANPTENK